MIWAPHSYPTFGPSLHDLKQTARQIFDQALADCGIAEALERVLRVSHGRLEFSGVPAISLTALKRLRVIAMGKAAAPMLEAVLARVHLPANCDIAGVLAAPEPPAQMPHGMQFFAGGHPLPNQASFDAASAALAMLLEVSDAEPDDALCLFLISGGASAMMELPLDPRISLEDTIAFHRELVHSGANIVAMNCVRKHFSAMKGGRLALAAGSTRKLSLLVSDVPPARLDALASGPTLPDTSTVADCRDVLERYRLFDRLPATVREYFESAELAETPKRGELDSPAVTLLDSGELAQRAQAQAETLGFHAIVDNSCDDWPFEKAGDYLLARLRELRRVHPRCCVISTGEVSVPVPGFEDGASHRGGRNQHLALYLATQLCAEDGPVAVVSAGSDGIDGNSNAAGAVVDERTLMDGADRESALRALVAYDSSPWLAARKATIVTGPTGQNLRDLRILLAHSA